MAVERFGVNNPLAVKLWSRRMDVEALKETFYARFIGSTSSSLAQELTETKKGKGDAVTWGLRALGSGPGVSEGQVLEGNEESVTHYTDSLLLNELRYGVRVKGEDSIDAQRVQMICVKKHTTSARIGGRTAWIGFLQYPCWQHRSDGSQVHRLQCPACSIC